MCVVGVGEKGAPGGLWGGVCGGGVKNARENLGNWGFEGWGVRGAERGRGGAQLRARAKKGAPRGFGDWRAAEGGGKRGVGAGRETGARGERGGTGFFKRG